MALPTLDLSALPDLETLTGVFGSVRQLADQDDSIVILATFMYEAVPPGSTGLI